LAKNRIRCVFGIDGLEDTNHIYRRNTRWPLIVENCTAFIRAGGIADWNFLIFKHNEHQVSEARAFAAELGFRAFSVKRTGRFFKSGEVRTSVPIMDSEGRKVGSLELPEGSQWRNPDADFLSHTYRNQFEYDKYLSETNISCHASHSGGIFVSAEGLVFPCCWMAQIFPAGKLSRRKAQVLALIEEHCGDRLALSAHNRSIEAIVNSDFFRFGVPDGWLSGPGRLDVCARYCGQHSVSRAQKGGRNIASRA
jgi:hypothetical protein